MKKIYILSSLLLMLASSHCAEAFQGASIVPCSLVADSVVRVTACDSFEWHGSVYYSDGIYLYDHTLSEPERPGVDTLV